MQAEQGLWTANLMPPWLFVTFQWLLTIWGRAQTLLRWLWKSYQDLVLPPPKVTTPFAPVLWFITLSSSSTPCCLSSGLCRDYSLFLEHKPSSFNFTWLIPNSLRIQTSATSSVNLSLQMTTLSTPSYMLPYYCAFSLSQNLSQHLKYSHLPLHCTFLRSVTLFILFSGV